MVNVVIYLKNEKSAKELANFLLTEKLIASASIDFNNVFYEQEEGRIKEEVYTVITCQSKSLLFDSIVKAVEQFLGEETPMYCLPIVASNKVFDNSIRVNTIRI
jgi:uncharacterized protein involved in tolerance to divalent cations